MNQAKNLILANDKNITGEVRFCQYNKDTGKYDITFLNGKTYSYHFTSVEWLREPDILNPVLVKITREQQAFFKVQDIRIFRGRLTEYWQITFSDGREKTYDRRELTVETSCLNEAEAHNCMEYLKQIAAINELKSPDGELLLQKQYEKLEYVDGATVLPIYLNPGKYTFQKYQKEELIFPFGGNASQFQAVDAALNSQISIVQGPPGTGKTQTILNIIANLLMEDKTVLVVSNNNSATANIWEKLASSQYDMGFLVAALGSGENKRAFVENQQATYSDLISWQRTEEQQAVLAENIKALRFTLRESFSKQERLAQARVELEALLLEIKYFEEYCEESGLVFLEQASAHMLKAKTLMDLWQECYGFSEGVGKVSFWFKVKSVFFYKVSDWRFYKNNLPTIVTRMQGLFYRARHAEIAREIAELEKCLGAVDAQEKMKELTKISMEYLRAKLCLKYGNKTNRRQFSTEDMWKSGKEIVKEYPIVLSTTFSARGCLKDVVYDYVIMDEASQVDVATGALALSCAKNAVIVGDLKQLPNVVKEDMRERSDVIFRSFRLNDGYDFSKNSFLKSLCTILPGVPQTLLREHYRCHPKIIGFCNQKFYNGELIIMTEDHGETDTLFVLKTNRGNHRRDHTNQRQTEVALQEALPKFKEEQAEEIGIIAPYKDQVAAIAAELDTDKIEVHTVHKFQGREKNAIILMTVDDVVTDFSDDPYLLNVAISRAQKKLCLVVSAEEQPKDSNIGDFISYIEYNNFEVVQSEIYSVFDLLYQQYTQARIQFLKKHPKVSTYDSENIMYGTIVELLTNRKESALQVVCHHPLNMLIRDPKHLNDEECRYAMNTATHLDFLIYNRITKKPVLAIEVDGFHYHKPGTAQYERDRMKDRILALYGIQLLRFSTTGSGEAEKIRQALDAYEAGRNDTAETKEVS